jgi:Leucine-rich repeat (LRR) protein
VKRSIFLLPLALITIALGFQKVQCAGEKLSESENQTVAILQKLGATVRRDMKKAGQPVIGLKLGKRFTDSELTHVQKIEQLQDLDLYGLKITDKGMGYLKQLKELNRLILSETKITDNGLDQIRGLKKLEILYLDTTDITDTGLAWD